MVLVKGIGEGLPVPNGGWRVKKTKGGNAMEQKTIEKQKTTQNQDPREIAKKLLSGEELTVEEALSLTDRAVAQEVYYLLWHYSPFLKHTPNHTIKPKESFK